MATSFSNSNPPEEGDTKKKKVKTPPPTSANSKFKQNHENPPGAVVVLSSPSLWTDAIQVALSTQPQSQSSSPIPLMLNDFELSAHALISKGNSEKALHRIRRLQSFRQAYKINTHATVYQAMERISTLVNKKVVTSFGTQAGQSIVSIQVSRLPSISIEAIYYLLLAMTPTVDHISKGSIFILNFDSAQKDDILKVLTPLRHLCRDSLPIKVVAVIALNAPPKLSAMNALCMPFTSRAVQQRLIRNSTTLIETQITDKSILPPYLGGTQTLSATLQQLERSLQLRWEHQEQYRIEKRKGKSTIEP